MHLEQDAQKQLMPGHFGSHSAPQPRVASSGALPAGRAVRCHAAWTDRVDTLRMHALDRAVSTVNGVLSKHTARDRGKVDPNTTDDAPPETVRQRGRAAVLQSLDETMGDGGAVGATAKAAASSKMIVLEAKTSVNRPLQEVEGRPIAEYLALPVDEYNMLDSSIVERVPGKERTFRLTFPFREWFHINLTPQVVLRVEPDVEHARVMFICEQLKFGNSVMDEKSDISFTTAVSRQLPHRNGKQTQLVAAMQLKAVLQPPPRASKALSSRALAAVANRMLTAVLATSTRPFLDGLARDYEDWALGRERKAETIDAQSMNAMLRKSVPGSELLH